VRSNDTECMQCICAEDRRLKVDSCEFQDDGRGHTFQTLLKLQEKNPDATLYFLVGGDKLNIITKWQEKDELFARFKFAVMKRNGTEPEQQIRDNPILLAHQNIFT